MLSTKFFPNDIFFRVHLRIFYSANLLEDAKVTSYKISLPPLQASSGHVDKCFLESSAHFNVKTLIWPPTKTFLFLLHRDHQPHRHIDLTEHGGDTQDSTGDPFHPRRNGRHHLAMHSRNHLSMALRPLLASRHLQISRSSHRHFFLLRWQWPEAPFRCLHDL